MKQFLRKHTSVFLLVVCLASFGMTVRQLMGNRAGNAAQSSAQQIAQASVSQAPVTQNSIEEAATQPTSKNFALPDKVWVPAPVEDDPQMEDLAGINLNALRQVNPEVVGWIRIPDTPIDFPLTQGADNTFYLEYTWDLVPSTNGNIFLECMNSPDMTDFNTILYGHNIQAGSMFGALRNYEKQDFFENHPYVYIVTDDGVFRYEIFSSYFATLESKTYGLSFNQEKTRVEFLAHALAETQIETGITPATTDRIITLSTCTGWGYLYRRVVHARLEMIEVYEA